MKVILTLRAIESVNKIIDFLAPQVSEEKIIEILNSVFERVSILINSPYAGQKEEFLAQYGKDHRRLVQGNYKIVYYIDGNTVYITDIFDARQDPAKMKG